MDESLDKSEALVSLRKIKEAEEDARKLVEEAQKSKASMIIQEAYEEAERIKKDYLAKAHRQAEEKGKAIIEKALSEAERIRKKAKEEEEALRRQAELYFPEAVEKARERIRNYLAGRPI